VPEHSAGVKLEKGAENVIAARDLAHVRFSAPDLDLMEVFLTDFGLVRAHRTPHALYMRGLGDRSFVHVTPLGEPSFIGLAFMMREVADLEILSEFEGASSIEDMNEPGAGKRVRFIDPDGFQVEAIAGQEGIDSLAFPDALPVNNARAKQRLGAPVRSQVAPAHVTRLGHCVLNVTNFPSSESWYSERFGLLRSDAISLYEDMTIGAFMRCDMAEQYVDHHSLFLLGTGRPGFNHAAFEVVGLDDLMTGHDYLQDKGYAHEWGVGRHILGSQIFDYWRDPWGHTVEHWTDGDLFNNQTRPRRANVETLLGVQWGPPPPPSLGS